MRPGVIKTKMFTTTKQKNRKIVRRSRRLKMTRVRMTKEKKKRRRRRKRARGGQPRRPGSTQ